MAVEIKALFDESRGSAGKRTLKARLKSKGIEVGLALIRQLMKQQGLVSKQPQKRCRTGTSEQVSTLFNNVLNRQFSPCADTTVLCGDTTYLKVQGEWHYLAIVMNLAQQGEWHYLAIVMNLAQRQVVGWRLQKQHNSRLVLEALNHAMLTTERTGKMLFHSD